jgi:hypothetical protein
MQSKSLAARTREAVRAEPFLHDALRAGVLNYTAVARYLEVEGEHDAIATALRRYAEDLQPLEDRHDTARVSMQSGVGKAAASSEALLTVGDAAFTAEGGGLTAIVATGDVDAGTLTQALGRLEIEGVPVEAAGVSADTLSIIIERRVGADALRAVESVVEA